MTTKTIDERGRLTLGREFAGCTVVVDDSDPGRILVTPMKLVPAAEAWLYENKTALAMLRRGLAESKAGIVGQNPPDLNADAELAKLLDD